MWEMGSTSPNSCGASLSVCDGGMLRRLPNPRSGGKFICEGKIAVPGNLLDLAAVKSRERRRFGSCSPEGLAPGNSGPQTPTKGASEVLKRGAVYCRGADDEPPQSRHQCWQKFSAEFFPNFLARAGGVSTGPAALRMQISASPTPLSAYQAG
jgi:hypothetical protein